MIAEAKAGTLDVKEAATRTAVEATAARARTTRRDAENLTAEARGIISPRMALRHHILVREVEAEAEGPAPLIARSVIRGAIGTSITTTFTSAQDASLIGSAMKKFRGASTPSYPEITGHMMEADDPTS